MFMKKSNKKVKYVWIMWFFNFLSIMLLFEGCNLKVIIYEYV